MMPPRLLRLSAVFIAIVVAASGAPAGTPGPASPPGRVLPGYAFQFPRDHFGHPEFESEWWYYTGNLFTASGRHFGFELTFFRRARAVDVAEPSAWDPVQVYLAHFTITDTDGERFVVDERVNRAGPGIAGADAGRETRLERQLERRVAGGRRGPPGAGADRDEPRSARFASSSSPGNPWSSMAATG